MIRNTSARSHFFKFMLLFPYYVVVLFVRLWPLTASVLSPAEVTPCLNCPKILTCLHISSNSFLSQSGSKEQFTEQNIRSSLTTEITIHFPQVSKSCHFEEAIFGLLGINQQCQTSQETEKVTAILAEQTMSHGNDF